MGSRIIVTGGAGYIGSHVAKLLVRQGKHKVLILDDLSCGFRKLARYGDFKKVDLNQTAKVAAIVKAFKPQGVFHFANSSLVGESVRDPGKYYRNNLGSTLGVLDALRTLKKPVPFIFSSTCAVYGEPQAPLNEQHPLKPVNPYGKTKFMVELLLEDYARAFGQPYVSLRYFNAAGADAEGELGELHEPETHLIPRLMDVALGLAKKKDPVQILGDDYPTPDGTCIRDYIHVEDLAAAHVAAFDYLADGGASTAFNLGTGTGHSVREVVTAVERVVGKSLQIPVGARRPGDPARLVAENGYVRKVLGWEAKKDLDTIVRSAWSWETK